MLDIPECRDTSSEGKHYHAVGHGEKRTDIEAEDGETGKNDSNVVVNTFPAQ